MASTRAATCWVGAASQRDSCARTRARTTPVENAFHETRSRALTDEQPAEVRQWQAEEKAFAKAKRETARRRKAEAAMPPQQREQLQRQRREQLRQELRQR